MPRAGCCLLAKEGRFVYTRPIDEVVTTTAIRALDDPTKFARSLVPDLGILTKLQVCSWHHVTAASLLLKPTALLTVFAYLQSFG